MSPQRKIDEETAGGQLALFLVRLTRGASVRELAHRFGRSSSTWGNYLNGAQLIPKKLVGNLVESFTTPGAVRNTKATRAWELWAAADAERRASRTQSGGGLVPPHQRRDDALQQVIKYQALAANAEKHLAELRPMLAYTQSRLENAELQLKQAGQRERARVERQLGQAKERLSRVRVQQERARNRRMTAEEQQEFWTTEALTAQEEISRLEREAQDLVVPMGILEPARRDEVDEVDDFDFETRLEHITAEGLEDEALIDEDLQPAAPSDPDGDDGIRDLFPVQGGVQSVSNPVLDKPADGADAQRQAAVRDLGGDVAPGAGPAVFAEDQVLPRSEESEPLLDVVEEPLEAQDAELDEFGEGVGPEPPASGDTAAAGPPVLPGQLADKPGRAADPGVPGQRQDSQDNTVNSGNDGSGQRGEQQLLDLLETVQTAADMARSFKYLEERDGSLTRLTLAGLAAKAFGDTPDTAQRWAAAQVLRLGTGKPMAWEHLEALVAALDATPEEVNAFERAHDRVRRAHLLLVSKAPTPVVAIRPKGPSPAAAGPGTPPKSMAARFNEPAPVAVGTIVVSIALIVIGLFQHTPGPFADAQLTTAGWWFTGSGVFLGLAPLISLFVHDARKNPVAPSETDDQPYDQTYGYPPMG
ncbi:hypothetical protein [Streptomyces sp. NRRL S-448]|uniref:hypothetical protein n=1 Tax=Streptomyces sp. NRRL S-448 TaxID=1463907 RepID=UPI003563D158